jgi:HEAT repeat protein
MKEELEKTERELSYAQAVSALKQEYAKHGPFEPGLRPSYPPLHEALDLESSRLRLAAVSRLAAAGDENGLLLLRSAVWDWYLPVRALAVSILDSMGETSAKETFLALASSGDFRTRFDALRLLAQLEDRSLLPVFAAAMKSPDARISTLASEALFSLGDRLGLEALIGKLRSGSYAERMEAAGFLAAIEDTEAEAALKDFLGSEDVPEDLRITISSTLERARRRKN